MEFQLNEVRIIPDIEKTIVKIFYFYQKNLIMFLPQEELAQHMMILQLNQSLRAFKVKYEYHKEAYKILENYYGKKKFNDGRKKMAKMPSGAKLIYNPSSAAPGFIIKNVLSLPGVPSILNSMIENCKKYLIKGLKVHSQTINLYTVESNISKQLGLIQKKYKKFVDIGSYPFFRLGKIGVAIVTRSTSLLKLKNVNKDLVN